MECPVTNLPVLVIPEYQNVPIKEGYYTSIKKIGDFIIYFESRGDLQHYDVESFKPVLESFCHAAAVKKPSLHITNMTDTTGRLSFGKLKQHIQFLYENQKETTGVILIQEPSWLKPFIYQALRLLKPSFIYVSVTTYRDALIEAQRILNQNASKSASTTRDTVPTGLSLQSKNTSRTEETILSSQIIPTVDSGAFTSAVASNEADNAKDEDHLPKKTGKPWHFHDIIFKPEWEYHNAETDYRCRIGAMPHQLFYVSLHGTLSQPDDISKSFSLLKSVIEENRLMGIPYFILDYSEVAAVRSIGLRQQFAKEVKKQLAETDNLNAVSVIINPDRLNRIAIRLFAPFVKQESIIVDSLEEAFQKINERQGTPETTYKEKNILVSASDLDEISNAFGMLQWDESDVIPKANISPDNPLAYLAESLELVKSDLNEFRKNERTIQKERLEESENARRKLIKMMRDVESGKSALEKEEEYRRILLDNIQTQVWYLTDETTYGAVNKAHADFRGLKKEEMAFRSFYDLYPQEAVRKWKESNSRVFTSRKPLHIETGMTHFSGEERIIAITMTPKLRPDGTVEYVVCSAEDITERKMTDQALQESERTYREIFNAINDTIWIHDIKTREFVDVNANVTKMFGYTVEEALQCDLDDISSGQPPYTKEHAAHYLNKAMNDEFPVFEWHCRHKNGHLFWSEVRLRKATINGIERIIAIERNITERKKAEAVIEKSLREKDILLSEIHHRVKNNMAVISSLLALQTEFADSKKNYEVMLKDLQTRIMSMAWVHELVYESKNFSQIQTDKLFNRLADYLKNIYQPADKDISVLVHTEEVMLDMNNSVPLTLIVAEVLSNAWKHAFTGRKKGKLEIKLTKVNDGFTVAIEDDGVGVPDPDKLNKPESFGYTIIHGLVSQIRGELVFSSPSDGGLRVEIRFTGI